ncbi:MAG: hypothetical protein ACI4QN_00990 [Candidatus Coproplasma sp.]
MKKLCKRISVVLLVACAVFACAFAVSACSKNTYTFVIQYEDGSALNLENVSTQICQGGKCIDFSLPSIQIYPDSNGKISITQTQVNDWFGSETDVTEFVFHVLNVEGYKDDCEFQISGAKEYTCKLYK